jgi:hypothetical protein
MLNRTSWLLGAWLLAFAAEAQGPHKKPRRASADEQSPVADCAKVQAEARMEAYGFSHVVVLDNRCDAPVVCDVSTDVDPDAHYTLRAAPGERAEVMTRRGSPSRDVTARSECKRIPR